MKYFIILLVCALQSINGNEDSVNQAITRGNIEIEKHQTDWQGKIQRFKNAVNEASFIFSTEFSNILKMVKDNADKAYAFADFRSSYALSYFSEVRSYIDIAAKEGPTSITKSFRPSELSQTSYNQITSAITALKNQEPGNQTCKESSIDNLTNYAVGTIKDITTCILNGVDAIQDFNADIAFLISYLPTITNEAIVQLRDCAEKEGVNCVNLLTNVANSESNKVKESGIKFPQDIAAVINLQKDVTDICISKVKTDFDSEITTTSQEIEKC